MAAPDKGTDVEIRKAKLLEQFTAQSILRRLAWLEPAARRDPESMAPAGAANADQQYLPLRCQEQRAHRLSMKGLHLLLRSVQCWLRPIASVLLINPAPI